MNRRIAMLIMVDGAVIDEVYLENEEPCEWDPLTAPEAEWFFY